MQNAGNAVDEDEGGDAGEPPETKPGKAAAKAAAKAKTKEKAMAKAKAKAKASAKGKGKGKGKGKAKAKAKAKASAKAGAQAKTEMKAAKPAPEPESNAGGEEPVFPEQVEPSKPRKARKVQTGTTKSEPKIPKTKDAEEVASAEAPEEPKPKRKRSQGGDVSFARRPPPTRRDGWAYYRWQAIRDVFDTELKTHLEKQSSHQDFEISWVKIVVFFLTSGGNLSWDPFFPMVGLVIKCGGDSF